MLSSRLLFFSLFLLTLFSLVCCSLISDNETGFISSSSLSSAGFDWRSAILDDSRIRSAALSSAAVVLLAVLYFSLTSSSSPDPFFSKPHPTAKHQFTQSKATDTDILVVGCGVGGASLAAALGKRGYRVTCIEQNLNEQHRIVGELMQPLGVQLMKNIGIAEALEGFDAQEIVGYCLMFKDDRTKALYPDVNSKPVRGMAFHNGKFVQALRKLAKAQPTVNLVQGTVKSLSRSGDRVSGVEWVTPEGERRHMSAALTVVCDGCMSVFRKDLIDNKHSIASSFVGLIIENCVLPQASSGHVIFADPSPVLTYPISSTEARVLVDYPAGTRPDSVEGLRADLKGRVAPQMPPELRGAFLRAVDKAETFPSMPSQSLCARPRHVPGTLCLGDVYNMRHPLTGGGMSVLMSDINQILGWIPKVGDWNDHQKIDSLIEQHYAVRSKPVRVINMLADALYEVFCAKNAFLRESCFQYLNKGGFFLAGPVSFLSGISANMPFLLFHFFSVALYTCTRLLPFPTPSRFHAFVSSVRTAVGIMLPLIVREVPSMPVKLICKLVCTLFWV